MWIRLSDSSYVTTAVESDSSLPQTCKSGTNEAGDILHHTVCVYQGIYVCMCVCVCVCYSMCCLSQRRLLLPVCRLMAPMSLLRESLNTFIIPQLPVSWWILFCPWTCTHITHYRFISSVRHGKTIYAHLHTCTHWIHGAVMQAATRFFFFLFFFWYNKYEGYQNLPYSNTDYLSDCEIKAA